MRATGWRGVLAWGIVAGLVAAGVAAAQDDPPRPNIVYIVVDDLGYADLGFQGSPIATPALDALAATGAELTNFYVQPMCTPTRAALMTGRYPLRYGLQMGVIPGAGTYGVPLDEYMLPQMLRDAGYRTAMVGKWHLGHADAAYWPMQRGSTASTARRWARSTISRMNPMACPTGTATTLRWRKRATTTCFSRTRRCG